MDRDRFMMEGLHTPNQSFSDSPTSTILDPSKMGPLNDSAKALKFKEEYDTAKMRLSDQKFDIRDYPDPLLPRDKSQPLPQGVTPELEKHLLEVIDRLERAA